MSIEQNGSGFLDLSSSIITSGDYTVLVYVKLNSASNFDTVLTYDNTGTDFVKVQQWSTDFRSDVDQQFANQTTGGAVVSNSWQRVILSSESSGNNPRIVVDGSGVTSGGQTGTFQTPASPQLRLFGNTDDSRILPNGSKIGLISIYSAQLDSTDEAWLDGGGDPSDLPSATAPVEVWLDTQGIVVDGSLDVTTWTGINGNVLTGSGSLREDGADLAPVTIAGAASITPTDTTPDDASLQTITASGMTGPLTAASIGGLDILSSLSSTDPSSPITFTVDVSATEASTGMPRIGETSTISFTTATDGAVTTDVTMQPKANWTTVTLAGTLDKTANGFLDTLDTDLGVTSAVGDIIYYSNARGEAITATGVYTGGTTVAYQSTEFVFQDVTGASATVAATSEGGQFYPFGEAPASSGDGPAVKRLRVSSLTIGL